MYALLARLDKPLHADVAATVRQLFVLCRTQLAALAPHVSTVGAGSTGTGTGDVPGTSYNAVAVALRLLAVIAGDYFSQRLSYE